MLVFTSVTISVNAQIGLYNLSGKVYVYVGTTGTTPLSSFDIASNGNPGVTIGSYAGINAAPNNGLIVSGIVGIGTSSPSSKLSVGGAGISNYTGYFYNSSTATGTAGLFATVTTSISNGHNFGIIGYDTSGGGNYACGVYGVASKNSSGGGRQYGVYGLAGNASTGYNYGVYGMLSGSNSGAGVYGTTSSIGDVAIPGKYAGYFAGALHTTVDSASKPSTSTWSHPSDKRLKTNIAPFTDGLNVIRKINPITYKYTGVGGLPTTTTNIGVIAQDVQPIAPYCIGRDKLIMTQAQSSAFGSDVISTFQDSSKSMAVVSVYSFNIHGLLFAMLNSIKQLDSTATSLQKQLITNKQLDSTTISNLQKQFNTTTTGLQQQINNCCTTGSIKNTRSTDSTNQTSSINSNSESVANSVLFQNNPNPFSVSTTINYYLDERATNAAIYIFDMQGTLLKTVNLSNTGKGSIIINGGELNAGMYMYSLVANGKEIDTKRMILTK